MWAFGMLLFTLAVGRPPFRFPDPERDDWYKLYTHKDKVVRD